MRIVTPRFVTIATVSAMLIASGAVSAVGLERYLDARELAELRLAQLDANVAAADQLALDIAAEAESLEQTGQAALAEAAGKTLDSTAIDAVTAAIAVVTEIAPEVADAAAELDAQRDGVNDEFAVRLWWPPAASELVATADATLDLSAWDTAKDALTLALEQLAQARAAWQAEQDRIAAEKAAAEAAAAAAAAARAAARAAASSISSSGGETAPVSPSLPSTPAPVVSGAVETYLANLEPRASVTWDADLCRAGTICGVTRLSSSAPVITLDSDLRDYYLTSVGLYVLVHEAAHARSWFRYGSVSALLQQSSAASPAAIAAANAYNLAHPSTPVDPATFAVEWMADCATIVKLGYSLGTYTAQCSPSELAEASSYW